MLLHWNNPTSWSIPSGFVHFGILRDQPIPVRKASPKAKGTTVHYGGNGATQQIYDLNPGGLAPWGKPSIPWIPT
jgi:hypothetical protein